MITTKCCADVVAEQRRHASGLGTYNKANMTVSELRAKVLSQQRDKKAHVLDKIQTQVELAMQLAASPDAEEREEALGRGEALWAMLEPSHALAPQIPAPTRTAVKVILSESMSDCARSIGDAAQSRLWGDRNRNRGAMLNPRDFDGGPRADPMSVFQFGDSYGSSGVVGSSSSSSNNGNSGSGSSASATSSHSAGGMRGGGGGGGGLHRRGQHNSPSFMFDGDEDDLAADDDDSFLDGSAEGAYLREKLRADGIDRKTLREERRAFDAEEAERRAADEAAAAKGSRARGDRDGPGSVTDHHDDDEKTQKAKEKLRKLFGDDNSNMGKHKQSVFNEHPLFTRGQKKWGLAVGPRYT